MDMTPGLLATMIANAAHVHLRDTASGFFNLMGGSLPALLAGLLWTV
ncbi:MAG: hypothetical protein ABI919_10470 [Ramlibacter sp.]